MSTTRSRAKGKTVLTTTDTNSQFDVAMHIGDLSAKISQLQVTVTASYDRRDTSEAETKQTVTEMRFELRRLQERYAKLLDALREQRREHLDTAKQLAALQQVSDKLFTVLCFDKDMSSKRDDAANEMHGHTRAESMVSDLDDARSEISSAVSASTARYAHSSLKAARASIRRS
jgi:hypothetical protein